MSETVSAILKTMEPLTVYSEAEDVSAVFHFAVLQRITSTQTFDILLDLCKLLNPTAASVSVCGARLCPGVHKHTYIHLPSAGAQCVCVCACVC